MLGVLVHTLPLAIAAAIATLAIASRMITFQSQLSILALAGIVFLGASSADLPSEGIEEPGEFRRAA